MRSGDPKQHMSWIYYHKENYSPPTKSMIGKITPGVGQRANCWLELCEANFAKKLFLSPESGQASYNVPSDLQELSTSEGLQSRPQLYRNHSRQLEWSAQPHPCGSLCALLTGGTATKLSSLVGLCKHLHLPSHGLVSLWVMTFRRL